jgi:hypothetical protein
VSPVKYELGFYITEDGILHSHRRKNLKSYMIYFLFIFNGVILCDMCICVYVICAFVCM